MEKYGWKAKKILGQLFSLRLTNKTMKEEPNFIYLNQLSAGEQAVKDRLLSVLKEEFATEYEDYKANISNSNLLFASEIVHKIRHKIGFLGMEKAYDLTSDYEKNLKNNSLDLKEEFETVLGIINAFILKN
jgi:uncharacterized radical SAM superfamily Fe-S cluster-containing enzyme